MRRARGAFALRAVMRSPWSLRIQAESPLTLIAGVAGELWVVPDETVGTVAEKVGYATPLAFSAAFKRVRGLSPKQHRAGSLSAA